MKARKDQLSLFAEKAIPKVAQWEYLIILSPSENIIVDIQLLKEKIKTLQINFETLYPQPHVIIKNHFSTNPNEADLISKIIAGQKSISINITGYAISESGAKKTLCLKIENPEPINLLHNLLSGKSSKHFVPNIAIAKNLTLLDFEKLEPTLHEFDYKNHWLAESVTMLKRLHDGKNKKFEVVAEFSLK